MESLIYVPSSPTFAETVEDTARRSGFDAALLSDEAPVLRRCLSIKLRSPRKQLWRRAESRRRWIFSEMTADTFKEHATEWERSMLDTLNATLLFDIEYYKETLPELIAFLRSLLRDHGGVVWEEDDAFFTIDTIGNLLSIES